MLLRVGVQGPQHGFERDRAEVGPELVAQRVDKLWVPLLGLLIAQRCIALAGHGVWLGAAVKQRDPGARGQQRACASDAGRSRPEHRDTTAHEVAALRSSGRNGRNVTVAGLVASENGCGGRGCQAQGAVAAKRWSQADALADLQHGEGHLPRDRDEVRRRGLGLGERGQQAAQRDGLRAGGDERKPRRRPLATVGDRRPPGRRDPARGP